jgi:hypothetical protein
MSDICVPCDVQVIWRLELPAIGPNHNYFEVPDRQAFSRLQLALKESGLPPARLLPQYERREGDQVWLGACMCYAEKNPNPSTQRIPNLRWGLISECARVRSLSVRRLSVETLADYFGIPQEYNLQFAELYHWDPWQHQWRLQEVNEILLRYGLPPRKKLEFSDGRRILSILGIWKDPHWEIAVVRYVVAASDGHRASTENVRYEQSNDVRICLAAAGKIAVTVRVDEMREREIWSFLSCLVGSKPTNTVLCEAIVPWLPAAKVSVSSLGNRRRGGRKQVFKLLRLPGLPDGDRGYTWKSWSEIKAALEQGILDHETELMVTRMLRRPKPEELFGAV